MINIFRGNIGYRGQDHINLDLQYDKELKKPDSLKECPDYLKFEVQIEGEETSFSLNFYHCKILIQEIERFMKIHEAYYTSWAEECKNKKKRT